MSKLSFVIFAVLLIAVACDQKADRAAQKKLDGARAACVRSINRACREISHKYHGSMAQLPTVEQRDAMFAIVRNATIELNALIQVARSALTVEVASGVKTAFGEDVNCYQDLAATVSNVTYQAYNQMNALVQNSQ